MPEAMTAAEMRVAKQVVKRMFDDLRKQIDNLEQSYMIVFANYEKGQDERD